MDIEAQPARSAAEGAAAGERGGRPDQAGRPQAAREQQAGQPHPGGDHWRGEQEKEGGGGNCEESTERICVG